MPRRGSNRAMRASPLSMTTRTPSMVSEVSATLVATIALRFDSWRARRPVPPAAIRREAEARQIDRSRARRGSRKWCAVISYLPGMKMSASPFSAAGETARARRPRDPRSDNSHRDRLLEIFDRDGKLRPAEVRRTQGSRYFCSCGVSSVADITTSFRSGRLVSWRCKRARQRDVAVEMALVKFVEQDGVDTPRSSGSSIICRSRMPSVTKRMRVSRRA